MEEVQALFPMIKGQRILRFKAGESPQSFEPMRVGVVLSGGQAAGGHNVISGLFDALKKLNPNSQLIGFLDGPAGIINKQTMELSTENIEPFRNQGGFDLLGSGRTKIETPEQFAASAKTVESLDLDGLVVIGGDDSNTNAALLAEYFRSKGLKTTVTGVPKTIDGDLKNQYVEVSFGFDTACKTYSEIIGNIMRDTLSAKKYWYFIKLMGRSASHITLECALQTCPNIALIGEELEAKEMTLQQVVTQMTDIVVERSNAGKDYGVALVPEGIIEFIPEVKKLIAELNDLLADGAKANVAEQLSDAPAACFESLPKEIQSQLLLDRDPHGNVQVSKIETERMLIAMVEQELQKRSDYKGKFNTQPIFCGYEGRSGLPSNFDSQYCYALGHVAALLINHQATGYICSVQDLTLPVEDWKISGVPLISMIHLEQRKGKMKPVIEKALVELEGPVFAAFSDRRERWKAENAYRFPGPIQFFGPPELTEAITLTLDYEKEKSELWHF